MRQPIVKDLRSKTKAKDLTSKAKDFIKCPRGTSRPRLWPRGLHHCWEWQGNDGWRNVECEQILKVRGVGVIINGLAAVGKP